MKGIKAIQGKTQVVAGQWENYTVSEWHSQTPLASRVTSSVKWDIYYLEPGKPPLLVLQKSEGRVRFREEAIGRKFLIVAYMYEPTLNDSSSIEITIIGTEKAEILKIDLTDVNDQPISGPLAYGQTINAHVHTTGMQGVSLMLSLYEDDAQGSGHSSENDQNHLKTITAEVGSNGIAFAQFMLEPDFQRIANAYLAKGDSDEGAYHEFYVTARGMGEIPGLTSSGNVNVANPPQESPVPSEDNTSTEESNSAETPVEAEPVKSEPVTVDPGAIDVEVPENKTPTVIGAEDGLLNAYFAKKEYIEKTDEDAGTYKYTFGGNKAANKTSTPQEKESVADAILNKAKINDKLKAEKRYTTKEAIIQSLAAEEYGKDTQDNKTVELKTFKLGPKLIPINSAPLEGKVYLVVETAGLDGKQATITIKEKDGVIKGSPDAILPVLEITEEQMEETETSEEVQGTEKNQFTVTVENGIGKVPIQLRPKSDEDLEQWKEKIAKGKEDGNYTYTFNNENGTAINAENKAKIAEIIVVNAKEGKFGNPKMESGKTAYKEDVEAVLEEKTYNKGDTITFSTYKKETEQLWLEAECAGENKNHKGEFLKKDGAYFVIGKIKEIIFPLLIKPENDTGKKWGNNYYWAASQGANQAAFNSNRSRGTRKHAGRDLYTLPETPVVAICKGKVLEVKNFYAQTHQVTVLHETNDGRKFIIRYGELAPSSITVKEGDSITQGKQIGVTGHLVGITVISGETVYMLHFEHYTGEKGYDLTTALSTGDKPFMRRTDLVDSIAILEEGYKNTFGENSENQLFTEEDGKEAITELYNKYKDKTWSWKWEGSEEEIEVSGKDLITIVEKMYRLETSHFKSKQYQNCGTGGMEAFGSPPYYGWDSSLFIEQPVGTWSAYEGKGLSGVGGNAQITTTQKEFVKLPSVLAGMEYKVKYIIKYNGNYARWFNKNSETAQKAYVTSLRGIRARFVEGL
ncbi:peptidoglycan DD-metalloendopeptidase family protein [Flavobacterium sediminilitoris]|uniref:Peptidoglycan DD-metalloendopeptidase family protein n=1 Tax=Flavobacterium sediminilitoris TaxID=2024526 RepID=A0ABY4HRG7_9FLAO|nr:MULTISPECIES: peptidoglycan DD-metalloendopeptidase family protein [Flavobacterium]UOX35487.1 peptidoglycan DD-metalloendopeptidase family protein [Flavobacterium sediminilitoris]